MEKIITKVAFYLKQASEAFSLFIVKQVINMLYLETLAKHHPGDSVHALMDHNFINEFAKDVCKGIEYSADRAQELLTEFKQREHSKDFSKIYRHILFNINKNIRNTQSY